jgi:hypothetical protein
MNDSVVVSAKPWWKSKTLLLNLIAAALIALEAQFTLLQPYLPGNVYAWFAVALTVSNAILRVITAAPLAFGFGGKVE